MIVTGNYPNQACKQLCERLEEVFLRSMRNCYLMKRSIEKKLVEILLKMRELAFTDEKGELFGEDNLFSYGVRKTIVWNLIYVSSLVRKIQNLNRDVTILLKRFRNYCKLVGIYCDSQVIGFDDGFLSPKRSGLNRSDSTVMSKGWFSTKDMKKRKVKGHKRVTSINW